LNQVKHAVEASSILNGLGRKISPRLADLSVLRQRSIAVTRDLVEYKSLHLSRSLRPAWHYSTSSWDQVVVICKVNCLIWRLCKKLYNSILF